MKQMLGWLWIAGAIAVLLVVQAFQQSEPLASVVRILNGARVLVPAGIAIAIVGVGLVLGAWVHGMVFDSTRMQPGKISGRSAGITSIGGTGRGRIGYFRGNLLWAASFHEESGFGEIKRSWGTGEWLTDRRLLRATAGMVAAPLLLVGVFGTAALVIDVTAVRLLLLLAVGYALIRLGFALVRA